MITRWDVTTGAVNVTAPATAQVRVLETGAGAEGVLRAEGGVVALGSRSSSTVRLLSGDVAVAEFAPNGDLRFTGALQMGTVPWARLSNAPSVSAGVGLLGGGDLSVSRALALNTAGISTCTGTTQKVLWDAVNSRLACGTDKDTTYTAGAGLALTGTQFAIPTGGITGAMVADGALTDADVAAGAGIAWAKVSKAGSSLADLATRTASDLTLSAAASSGVPLTLENTGLGGRRYVLYSTGTTGGTAAGSFAVYDATAEKYRLVIYPDGDVSLKGTTNIADLSLEGGETYLNNLFRMGNVRAASTSNTNDIVFAAQTSGTGGGYSDIASIITSFNAVNHATRNGLVRFNVAAAGSSPTPKLELDGSTIRAYARIVPNADNVVDLGASGLRFNDIWAGVTHFGDACGSNDWCFTEGPPERPAFLLVNDTRALKFAIHEDGYTPGAVASLGTCGPHARGQHQFVLGGEDADDQEYVCLRTRDGTYAWKPLTT